MRRKLIFSSLTNRGVAADREPGEDEFAVSLPPSTYAWFIETPQRYQYVNDVFSEYSGWAAELAREKAIAEFGKKLGEAEKLKNAVTFEYNGNKYYDDFETITGYFVSVSYLPDGFAITWKTADKEADGVTNVEKVLDKAGIVGLGLAYLSHRTSLWQNCETVKKQIKSEYIPLIKG